MASVGQAAGVASWPDFAVHGARPCSWDTHQQNASKTAQMTDTTLTAGCLTTLWLLKVLHHFVTQQTTLILYYFSHSTNQHVISVHVL